MRALYAQGAGHFIQVYFDWLWGIERWMTIRKSCSSTRPSNWTRWSRQKTPPSCRFQAD
jgi:hypothetical protein